MKRKILSLFLALSMLSPVTGVFPIVSSAENTNIAMHTNSDDALTPEHEENISEIENDGYEETASNADNVVLYANDAVLTLGQYDEQLAEIASRTHKSDEELAEDTEYINVILQRRLVEKAGYDNIVSKMSADAAFAACMEWLFSDTEMLRYYSYGGAPEANPICSYDKLPLLRLI